MAISHTSSIQDKIAYRVWSIAYTNLSADQKAKLDGTATVPTSTPGGVAGEALERVEQYAQYFGLAGADSAPDAWEHWYTAEAAFLLAQTEYPDRAGAFNESRLHAQRMAMESLSLLAPDEGSDTTGYSVSRDNIRKLCIIRAVRRPDPIFPQIEEIDFQIRRTVVELWNRMDWSFAREQATATLKTDDTVTVNVSSGETFEYVTSINWYYESTSSGGGSVLDRTHDGLLRHVTSDQMAALKASKLSDGRPAHFRVLETGSAKVWELDRTPDQQYTVYGEVKLKSPSASSPSAVDAAIARFPNEFEPAIVDAVYAGVLKAHGARDWRRYKDDSEAEIEGLLPVYADQGPGDPSSETLDVYHDALAQGQLNIGEQL